ncbi:hypothetical protein [Bifidobacterium phasiani]|uniref:Uncharacterized protein n=1 Tax=Bifidobacterium phasiani TaxID=2834431 RepID=A0ABS6WB57_9BIFI|nr:hypothetical protein [Bifidobacterium phasiani]MBW3083741.1 hypothetical protein [Bifidobacterium phasiani]
MRRMKKYLARIIACILSAATLLVMVPAANADVTDSQSDSYVPCAVPSVDKDLENLLWKIVDAGEYFGFEGKRLTVALSEEQLKSDYGFSDAEYAFLVNNVLTPAVSVQDTESYPTTFASCSGVYISYVDFTVGFAAALFAASSVSPAALAAAFTAVASAISGPVGAILAGGVAVLGIGFFADLAVKIVGAVAQGKGVCLTLAWEFPPLKSEIM